MTINGCIAVNEKQLVNVVLSKTKLKTTELKKQKCLIINSGC
jgi:hypothetical protein